MNSIKIVRSNRRKKTVQARIIGDTYCVYLPDGLSKEIEDKWVAKMVKQLKQREKQKQLNSDNQLKERADRLNTQYFNGSLEFTIQFVVNQHKRFGSCNPHSKMIRISNRLATMPIWVQNYVILHELTHLVYPDHSAAFWKKVNEFSLTERARGYLIAIGMTDEL